MNANVLGFAVALCGAAGCTPLLDAPGADFSDGAVEPGVTGSDGVRFLKGDAPSPGAWFGYSAAARDDVLVVTAPFETVATETFGARRAGATYVFEREGRDWSVPVRLVASNADPFDGNVPDSIDAEGRELYADWSSMRLALDERTLAVGVAAEDSGLADEPEDNSAPQAGAVYVYDMAALESPPAYLKAPAPDAGDLFGMAIGLSGDWLAIGAPREDGGTTYDLEDDTSIDSGAVFMYRRGPDGFEFAQYLKAPNADAEDLFGTNLALEGELLVVAAPFERSNAAGVGGDPTLNSTQQVGAVYAFRLEGERWEFEEYIKHPNSVPLALFGSALALSGGTLAVSAPTVSDCENPIDGIPRGAVSVYRRDSTSFEWTVEQCLSPAGVAPGGLFGISVSLHRDILLVGAPWESNQSSAGGAASALPYAGAAYEFVRAGADWSEGRRLTAPVPAADDGFGMFVLVTPDSHVIGAPRESSGRAGPFVTPPSDGARNSGTLYFFEAGRP